MRDKGVRGEGVAFSVFCEFAGFHPTRQGLDCQQEDLSAVAWPLQPTVTANTNIKNK